MILTIRNLLVNLINIVLAVILFFIGFRFLLNLLGANSQAPFVAWIYQVSNIFVYPFQGIFPNLPLGGNAIIDIVAVISIVAYTILGYLLIALIESLTPRRTVYTTPTPLT